MYYLQVSNSIKNLTTNNQTKTVITLTKSCTGTFDVLKVSDMISVILRTFAPFCLMITFNIILIKDLFLSKRNLNREIRFTVTVLLLNISFLIFNGPLSVVYIIINLPNINSTSFTTLFWVKY
jgi:hypothetical protein